MARSSRDAAARVRPMTPPLSRRAALQALVCAGASLSLASCTVLSDVRQNGTPAAGAKVQLVYQDWRTDWFPGMARQMLDQFHAAHPNIRVFYTPDPENLAAKMLDDMAAGTSPDVFQGCCTHFPVWAQKGYTLDLRPYVQADLDKETVADWDPVQYRALFGRDGRQFGLPKYHGALALFYNKDIFDTYRVSYPDATWTYTDYLAAMRRLTRDSNGDGRTDLWGSMVDVSWDRLQVYANAWGGHFVDPENASHSQMAGSATLAAMRWLRDRMWVDKVMATPLDVENLGTQRAFIDGRLAMVEDGSWALKGVLSGATFRIGTAPLPAGPVRRATLTSTDGFGIFAGTKHPEAAWELLKFLISKDYGRAMARAHLLQPARLSLLDEWLAIVREEYPERSKDMDVAAFADGHRKGYSVVTETFTNMAPAERLAAEAWVQVFTLGQQPVDFLVDLSSQIEAAQPHES